MKKLLAVLLCLTFLTGCSRRPTRFSAVYTDVFDTVTEFTAYCQSSEEFEKYSGQLHGELLRLHGIFDIYSYCDGINNARSLNEAGEPIVIPAELMEVIASGLSWYDETGGKLDLALGSVLRLWEDCREKGVLPDDSELKARAEHISPENIVIEGETCYLSDPETSLDFGALAKGYAAEKCAEMLEGAGLSDFAISCGGNVVTRGKKPSGSWEIAVEDPNGGFAATVKVSGLAVVTSGDYQRFYEVDGVRYHHIIDPDTLYPASLWRSVTVVSPSSAEADALSTALFCLDLETGRELCKNHGAEAMWIDKDGNVTETDGFGELKK